VEDKPDESCRRQAQPNTKQQPRGNIQGSLGK
jgi:hypothetical protein